ncbi:MAG: molybdenum cofactor guanylyltransferase [Bacteroidales bacterium]|nr:molybdenum cofactor guanylyltransferase [Bacteroidales bacterium]
MNSSHSKITGILLAGGMSKRMGREKGILKIGDRFLYQYPLRILEALCDEILISTCKNFTPPLAYPTVCDEVAGIGPMGGIYTCLNRSSNDLNIVLSYDMPLVNEGLLKHLIHESEAHDIVLPALQKNKPEPLCSIYRKSVAGVFRDLIEKNIFAVHRILPLVNSRTILIDDRMPFYNPDIFLNINQESDLNRLPPGL